MPETEIEVTELEVNVNCGHLLGNTLRQFAMRGVPTWQPAGYRVTWKEGSFGFSAGCPFSYLDLNRGHILSNSKISGETEKICTFQRQGELYVYGDLQLEGLGNIGVSNIDVCLVYASGSRTTAQNASVIRNLCKEDEENFAAVSSRHTPTIKFSFDVKPYDGKVEILTIKATPGVVSVARDLAVDALTGLHIR